MIYFPVTLAKIVECKALTKEHPLAVKDEFSSDYYVLHSSLKDGPFYNNKFLLQTFKFKRKNNELKREDLVCNASKGIIICPARIKKIDADKVFSFKVHHKFITIVKHRYKVKKKGVYPLPHDKKFYKTFDKKYDPREFFQYVPKPERVPYYSRMTGNHWYRSWKDFYVFGDRIYSFSKQDTGILGIRELVEDLCVLDLDLEKFPPFEGDQSVVPAKQKR